MSKARKICIYLKTVLCAYLCTKNMLNMQKYALKIIMILSNCTLFTTLPKSLLLAPLAVTIRDQHFESFFAETAPIRPQKRLVRTKLQLLIH